MANDVELAQVETFKAFQVGRYVVLVIEGERPTPCHEVDIELLPIRIFPPQFRATQSVNALARCTDNVVRYERAESFPFFDLAGETLTIEAANGDVQTTVVDVEEDVTVAARGPGARIDDIVGPPVTAIGFSNDYDLGAAIKDAIGQLPQRGGGIPDWLAQYKVIGIGAEIGGIAGLNRLWVRVSG